MPQVVISPAAAGDLVELRGLLSEQFGEIVADKKLVRQHLLLKRLESFPELGRRRDSLGRACGASRSGPMSFSTGSSAPNLWTSSASWTGDGIIRPC